jgi:hypothetical protein
VQEKFIEDDLLTTGTCSQQLLKLQSVTDRSVPLSKTVAQIKGVFQVF